MPKTPKMASFFFNAQFLLNLITERTSAPPWWCRNAGAVRAPFASLGGAPRSRALQLEWQTYGRKWRFWWLRPCARARVLRRSTWRTQCAKGENAMEGACVNSRRRRWGFGREFGRDSRYQGTGRPGCEKTNPELHQRNTRVVFFFNAKGALSAIGECGKRAHVRGGEPAKPRTPQ